MKKILRRTAMAVALLAIDLWHYGHGLIRTLPAAASYAARVKEDLSFALWIAVARPFTGWNCERLRP